MRKKHHLIIILSLIILAVATGYGIFRASPSARNAVLSRISKTEPDTVAAAKDTVPYLKKLQSEIPVMKVLKAKRTHREVWMVGRGISLPNYLLRAQRHLERYQGQVLRMEELTKSAENAADFDFVTPKGDTMRIELRVSDTFLDSASQLAVAFTADTLSLKQLSALSQLPYPFALLITPFRVSDAMFQGIDQLNNKELVIWLPMEGYSLQSKDLAENKTILIHLTKQEIDDIVNEARKRMPSAVGVATRIGQRAVEHEGLLDALFENFEDAHLWFLDLTQNRYSRVADACKNYPITCKRINPYTAANATIDQYISDGMRSAIRNGAAIMVFPLTDEVLDSVQGLKGRASAQGTEIVPISHVIASGE